MITSTAIAGSLTPSGSDFTIAEEALPNLHNMTDVDITRLFQDLAYTITFNENTVNGGSQQNPSFNVWLSNGNLRVVTDGSMDDTYPTICYQDPETGDWNPVGIFDHTEYGASAEGTDMLVFKTVNANNSVSINNTYTFRKGMACDPIDGWEQGENPYGEFGPADDLAFYADDIDGSSCTVDAAIHIATFDSSNTDRPVLDTANTGGVLTSVKEFHTRLAAKTFGEIKLMEWIDVRDGQAPINDEAGDYVQNNSYDDDIHEHVTDPMQPSPYLATEAHYYLLPHANINSYYYYTPSYEVGTYQYYLDMMDMPQQADPIAMYVQVTDAATLDYSAQTMSNHFWWDTNYDNWEPDDVNGVRNIGWWTNAGSLELVDECDEHNYGVDCDVVYGPVSGNEFAGIAYVDGLQYQAATINWMNSQTRMMFESYRTGGNFNMVDGSEIQMWPDDGACAPETMGDTGYWQWGGFHAFVPGIVEKDGVKQSNIKIYNGLVQDDTDRLHKGAVAGDLGYNDESNIARAASVYMRLIDDNGYIVTVDMGTIAANSAMGYNSDEMLTAGQAKNPLFAANGKFAAEVFVDNDPNAVHVFATQTFDDMTNPRVLPVYTDASEEATAILSAVSYNVGY